MAEIIYNMLSNKKIILSVIVFIIISNSICYSQIYREIVVGDISSKCIDTTYVPSLYQTSSYPSRTHYTIDKFVYELKITIKLFGSGFSYNKPLAITCYIPDNKSKTIIVNQELFELKADNSYEYIMILKTSKKGEAKITVGEWDDYNLRINQFNGISFFDKSFYLE